MRSESRPLLSALALLLPVLAHAADCALEDPYFATGARRPTRLVVLPAHATTLGGDASTPQPSIEPLLVPEVHGALERTGWVVDADTLAPAALARDRGLAHLVDDAWQRWLQVAPDACPLDGEPLPAPGDITIAETALPLAAAAHADGLVLVRARSIVRGAGLKALIATLRVAADADWPVPSGDLTWIEIAILDGRDGRLLAVNVGVVEGSLVKHPLTVVEKGVDRAVSALPLACARSEWLASPDSVVGEMHRVVSLSPERREHERLLAALTLREGAGSLQRNFSARVHAVAPDVLALFDIPAEARPEPQARILLRERMGDAGLLVRNRLATSVRVSIGLERWVELAPDDELLGAVDSEHAWLLVADANGRELARAECADAAKGLLVADLLPR